MRQRGEAERSRIDEPRPRYGSDEEWNDKRRKGPRPGSYLILPHSMTHAPLTISIYRDNDALAQLIRLDMLGSKQGSAHKDDRLELSYEELPSCMGVTRYGPARRALEALCARLRWQVLDNPQDRTVQIHMRKFAKLQGLTPRKARSESADSAVSPSPSPTATAYTPPTPSAESARTAPQHTRARGEGSHDPDHGNGHGNGFTPAAPTVATVGRILELFASRFPTLALEDEHDHGDINDHLEARVAEYPELGTWEHWAEQLSKIPFFTEGRGRHRGRATLSYLTRTRKQVHDILHRIGTDS